MKNETWSPPGEHCIEYTCDNSTSPPTAVESKTKCAKYNPDDCVPGTETTDDEGCCKTCELRSVCKKKTEEVVVEVDGCKNPKPIQVPYCTGTCGSTSRYSMASNTMMHKCACCEEKTTSKKEIQLTCKDGTTRKHTYTVVETCGCNEAVCKDRS
ncbi:hypothetical protein CRUP_025378 [Coryphaenoides rupestris]|nr:hypothetical protein CRUP_025378 [Coryphaenoides rupestris]